MFLWLGEDKTLATRTTIYLRWSMGFKAFPKQNPSFQEPAVEPKDISSVPWEAQTGVKGLGQFISLSFRYP